MYKIKKTPEYLTQLNYCLMMSDKLFNKLANKRTPPDQAKADIIHLRRELLELSKEIKNAAYNDEEFA